MTLRDYKKFMTREVLTNEYEQYIRQFTYMPAADAIQAEYDANSSEYIQADFNYYFVTAATDDSGNVTGLDDAKAQGSGYRRRFNGFSKLPPGCYGLSHTVR